MISAVPARDLASLPKAHLHVHLEGAMRPETLRELAERDGDTVPAIRGFGSFTAFVSLYVAACRTLRSFEDLARLTREVVQDAARDGAVWVEPSVYPVHHERLGSLSAVVEAILDAGQTAAKQAGIGFGLMSAPTARRPPQEAQQLAELAAHGRIAGWSPSGSPTTKPTSPPSRLSPRSRSLARQV